MLRVDEAATAENNAYSSPTLIINGVLYNGARTPEAYKQAIELNPTFGEAWQGKGNAQKALDKAIDAEMSFYVARKLGYND